MALFSRGKIANDKAIAGEADSPLHAKIRNSGLFDADWYLAVYPDVAAAGLDPIAHYLKHGAAEGRNPGPRFDTIWYLSENPQAQAMGLNPLVHYIDYGANSETGPLPLNEGQRFEAFDKAVRNGSLEGGRLLAQVTDVHYRLAPRKARATDWRPPLPPLELSARVGSPDLDDFDAIGREGKIAITRCLPKGFSFEKARCLDFGCGAGRVIRHFAKEAALGEFWGCDVDGTSILWNAENLSPPFRFFQLGEAPLLPLESSSFDLVYALAVFSQLYRDWHMLAMEIRRILKPGGVFFMSFNGQTSFEEMFRKPYDEFFRETGMAISGPFHPWNRGGPTVAFSPDWIKTHWGALFDIDYIAMEGFMNYQSFCVMRKPQEGAPQKLDAPVLKLGLSQPFNPDAVGAIAPRFDAALPFLESYGVEGAGLIEIGGWIVFRDDQPSALRIGVDDGESRLVEAAFAPRTANHFNWGAPAVDFKAPFDLAPFSKGAHRLVLTLESRRGLRHVMSMPLKVG